MVTREIYAYRCRNCGELHYPFRMVCKSCGQNRYFDFDLVPLPKKGKVLTYTHVHNLPADFAVARLGLAVVELENGMRMLGQLDCEKPKMGMSVVGTVEPVRRLGYTTSYGMVFRAA